MRHRAGPRVLAGTLALVASLSLPTIVGAAGTPSLTATAASRNPVLTSEVWVTFGRGGGYTSATVSGTALDAAAGAVVTLEATTFPFHAPMAAVQSAPLDVTGTTTPFSFTVAPGLETRYQVELFASSSATTPEAVSAILPVYVTSWSSASNAETCTATTCTIRINQVTVLPRTTIPVEKSKHQFVYLDVVRWNGGAQPHATTFHLVTAVVTAPRVQGDHVRVRITITYRRPSFRLWWWYWESCTRDTVARDGLGLAGPHGCGKPSVSPHATYLG